MSISVIENTASVFSIGRLFEAAEEESAELALMKDILEEVYLAD